jgi:hypothetical protein
MNDRPHEVQCIPVTDLTLDAALQPRCEIDLSLIEDYAMLLMEGNTLPPLSVFQDAENRLWLADGFHRLRAHQALDRTEVPCHVEIGERIDAIRYSVVANAKHGKPRSRGDLARSYEILKHEGLVEPGDAVRVQELLQCSSASAFRLTETDRQHARRVRERIIAEKRESGQTLREISQDTGVSLPTVSRVIARDSQNSHCEKWNKTTTPEGLQTTLGHDVAEVLSPVPVAPIDGTQTPGDRSRLQPDKPTSTVDSLPRFEDYVDPVALDAWYRVIKALQAFTDLQPVPDLIQTPCPQVFYAVDAALPAAWGWLQRFHQEFDHVKQLSETA